MPSHKACWRESMPSCRRRAAPIRCTLHAAEIDGICILGPEALDLVPDDHAFDMPDLFEACRKSGLTTLAHPVQEYWVNIGHLDNYRRANEEFSKIF